MTQMIRRMATIVLGVLIGLSSLGCNVIRVSLNTSLVPEDVAFIVPGKTTLSEVVAHLGAPDSMVDSDSGVVATYRFLDLKYSRVNFGWLAKPWTPVDPDLIFPARDLGLMPLRSCVTDSGSSVRRSFFGISSGRPSIPIRSSGQDDQPPLNYYLALARLDPL